jgi:hypothetical protein
MDALRRFGVRLAQKLFSIGVWQSAQLIWAGSLGAFLLIVSPPLMAIIGIEPNPVVQHHAALITVVQLVAAIVLTGAVRVFASVTIPSMDRIPTLQEAYDALKPPFWAKPIVRVAVWGAALFALRKSARLA